MLVSGQYWKIFQILEKNERSYGKRRVCYFRNGQDYMDKLKFVKIDSFAPGFMVWAGVSFYEKTNG